MKKLISNEGVWSNFWRFFWFPIAVFIAHVILQLFDAYSLMPWVDMPMHYLGGVAIAYTIKSILIYLQDEKAFSRLDQPVFLLLVFSLAATSAVFWEFGEFVFDRIFGTNSQISLFNAMRDLFFGVAGGFTLVFCLWMSSDD